MEAYYDIGTDELWDTDIDPVSYLFTKINLKTLDFDTPDTLHPP